MRDAALQRSRLLCPFLLAIAGLAGAAAAAPLDGNTDGSDSLDIELTADACASVLAASVRGDAQGGGGCVGLVSCASVSGTGNATSNAGMDRSCASGGSGAGVACVAASGTGDATNTGGASSCGVDGAVEAGCLAVSGTGRATNTAGSNSCGSGDRWAPVPRIGLGCVAASGTGPATNAEGSASCGAASNVGSLFGMGIGYIAVSGTGDAANEAGGAGCGRGTGTLGVGVGCIAVSGTGATDNHAGGDPCMPYANPSAGPTVSVGCVGVGLSAT